MNTIEKTVGVLTLIFFVVAVFVLEVRPWIRRRREKAERLRKLKQEQADFEEMRELFPEAEEIHAQGDGVVRVLLPKGDVAAFMKASDRIKARNELRVAEQRSAERSRRAVAPTSRRQEPESVPVVVAPTVDSYWEGQRWASVDAPAPAPEATAFSSGRGGDYGGGGASGSWGDSSSGSAASSTDSGSSSSDSGSSTASSD